MTRVLVIPDLHGRADYFRALLRSAGVTDAEDNRLLDADHTTVVSLGDLIDGRQFTSGIDNDILELVLEKELLDWLLVGNHEWPFFGGLPFGGFAGDQAVRTGLNRLAMRGMLVPSFLVGDTLLTHAGVNSLYDFQTPQEAQAAILDAWENFDSYGQIRMSGAYFSNDHVIAFPNPRGLDYKVPKGEILGGVPAGRGGNSPRGGILWRDDYEERLNVRFSQVYGHTPMSNGPVLTQHMKGETFTINLDAGAKAGLDPYGVLLDGDSGDIIDFVEVTGGEEG